MESDAKLKTSITLTIMRKVTTRRKKVLFFNFFKIETGRERDDRRSGWRMPSQTPMDVFGELPGMAQGRLPGTAFTEIGRTFRLVKRRYLLIKLKKKQQMSGIPRCDARPVAATCCCLYYLTSLQ